MTGLEGPSVSLSFANNFWGKDDAGVNPLLDRMHNAKVTSEELKDFYHARSQIEEEYCKKLLNLSKKPLGSCEAGTLRMSLDVVRAELESTGKAHQAIAGQMKQELEEPLVAFAGGLKERRKIIQTGIEKLLATKIKQTNTVNKARDRYEQDCLKIKGYLAQGHMVMGQEERKNKAKLEKTQIQMSTTSQEYEQAVRVLEETTGRWNREWKAACDKFQDLEEERLDFTKSSLWSFANISSTVCVSDDASCEKIRLSLEDCDVEKDITGFIKEQGTGQEIPDPPKYINFCRGDIPDNASEHSSDDGAYSVAQFARAMNPAFRTSSPQPSTYSSHHRGDDLRSSVQSQEIPQVPHDPYPMDGMTQFCRLGPPSERSSIPSPEMNDSHSEYSNPTSFSSFEPTSPMKQEMAPPSPVIEKKKSGFFQNKSPFRRKSKHDLKQTEPKRATPWATRPGSSDSWRQPDQRSHTKAASPVVSPRDFRASSRSAEPEPVDPRANFQLNVGNNVFDVASPDQSGKKHVVPQQQQEDDPIAQALAELKGVTKQASTRVSADRYAGISTPAPDFLVNRHQGTPPPSYESRLGAPKPAHTSRTMQQTTANYVGQRREMFNRPMSTAATRTASPAPIRSASPRPFVQQQQQQQQQRAPSPNPNRPRANSSSPQKMRPNNIQRSTSPMMHARQNSMPQQQPHQRPPSSQGMPPQQQYQRPPSSQGLPQQQQRPPSSQGGNAAMVLADERSTPRRIRPTSQYYGADGGWAAAASVSSANQVSTRVRSQSSAGRPMTKDGRPILNYSRAVYMYTAAIPEELSFAKNDILAVLRLQDDGWWEAELKNGKRGLVPSNYLVPA
ncbi:hypothetical protein AAFC00_001598 [Neodothiora populina]|uniref:Uncharacterized protein n=1 Tax=Neodothiora populina TaxID=2781224 RepID=A0ABR3PPU0_9PEZI